jgi:hypothetical protein
MIKVSSDSRDAELGALAPMFDGGYLRVYGGTQPATPEDSHSCPLVAELRFGSPAFAAPSGGQMQSNAIAGDSNCVGGTARWCRAVASDGFTTIMDGDVATSGAFLNVNTTNVKAGATFNVSSVTINLPM